MGLLNGMGFLFSTEKLRLFLKIMVSLSPEDRAVDCVGSTGSFFEA